MTKKKIELWIPVAASVKFTAEIDTDVPGNELFGMFLELAETETTLCWQCGEKMMTDCEMSDAYVSDKGNQEEFMDQILKQINNK